MYRRGSSTPHPSSLSRDNADALARYCASFERLAGEPLPVAGELAGLMRVRRVPRGDIVFAAGALDQRIIVVLDGFLTLRYESPDGTSWVKGFVPPDVPYACVSCLDGHPAPFHAHAGIDCAIASVPFQAIERVAETSMAWQRAVRNAFKIYGQRKEKREMELLMHSAEERYIAFLHEFPEIAAKLRQHEIASYVRVTPVSLSRIRRRLRLVDAAPARRKQLART